MEQSEAEAIERACERLVVAYAHRIDQPDAAGFAALFANAGRLVLPTGELVGRDAIAQALRRRPATLRSRHVITNVAVRADGRARALGLSYLTLYRGKVDADGPAPLIGPTLVGTYHDEFVLEADRWLFARRELKIAFAKEREVLQ